MYHYKQNQTNTGGYTTLLLVTIIGFSFLVSIGVISREVRRAQDRSLASQQQLEAVATAVACRQEVLVKLFRDTTYQGNESVLLDSVSCAIGQVTVDTVRNEASFTLTTTVGNYVYREEFKNQGLLELNH